MQYFSTEQLSKQSYLALTFRRTLSARESGSIQQVEVFQQVGIQSFLSSDQHILSKQLLISRETCHTACLLQCRGVIHLSALKKKNKKKNKTKIKTSKLVIYKATVTRETFKSGLPLLGRVGSVGSLLEEKQEFPVLIFSFFILNAAPV